MIASHMVTPITAYAWPPMQTRRTFDTCNHKCGFRSRRTLALYLLIRRCSFERWYKHGACVRADAAAADNVVLFPPHWLPLADGDGEALIPSSPTMVLSALGSSWL